MDYPFCPSPPYVPGDPGMYDLRWMVSQIQSLTALVQGIAKGQESQGGNITALNSAMADLAAAQKCINDRLNAGDFEKLTAQAAQLDENALMLRYLRGRMKLNDGVVEPLFRERFGQELPQEFSTLLDKAVENGLAQRTADGWMPTLEGLFRGEVL